MFAVSDLMHTKPIIGPAAWVRADFTGPDQWTVAFSADDIAELFAALEHARATGKAFRDLTRDDFPLDGLVAKLREVSRELDEGRGFVVLSGFPIDSDIPGIDVETMYWGLCAHLGTAVTQNGLGEVIVRVADYGNGGLANSSSRGYQTNESLPFHTDSSDIVGLLCLNSAGAGGQSSLTSSMTIHNELVRDHRELLGVYYTGFYYDRRDEQSRDELPYYRNSVFAWHHDRLTCRYYLRQFIESARERFGIHVSEVEQLALDTFDMIANRRENKVDMHIRPGEIQLVNNNVIVHARAAYTDTDRVSRELLRIWLNPSDSPAPPAGHAAFRDGMPPAMR
ncbi:TauD/TfdA family dioxygenase [Nocardia sp. NPDC058518]|uniref:TauD/TfdA family dioxygenase n=1 Tax=Nocardia sp. NPDC058518 TaxID=3346534 RepID=UPI00366763D9